LFIAAFWNGLPQSGRQAHKLDGGMRGFQFNWSSYSRKRGIFNQTYSLGQKDYIMALYQRQ
jgi:hypothetical protein